MRKAVSKSRVNGFLDVKGRKVVNQAGEEVLLVGWGLGNWLMCEGYMWCDQDVDRLDRPRRIEAVIEELTGKAFADKFWEKYRENYITESDIQMIAEMGYNSVRIPINSRLFLQEGPGIRFVDEGFTLLDRVLDWCEQHRLYAFIDMHGAPGGQTGSNTDDSVDDVCRLLIDQDQFEKGLVLWETLAERYADRWIVGGYDLLNEPIRPVRYEGDVNLDHLVPRLREFYEQCIARIRLHDQRHIITLEGYHGTTGLDIFDHVYDPKMMIHFHRYGCPPDLAAFKPFLDVSAQLNVPLCLGETGENTMEWFSALIPLAASLDIGVSMWPWKKMDCTNSPCSVMQPENWQLLIDYAKGGVHPGYEKAQKIFTELLKNVLVENCFINENISANVFRIPGCVIAGTDFDELPGNGVSYGHQDRDYPVVGYRQNTGMQLYHRYAGRQKRFPFDGAWAQYVLRLSQGEFTCYTLYDVSMLTKLEINCYCPEVSVLEIYQDEQLLGCFDLSATKHRQVIAGLHLTNANVCTIKLRTVSGTVDVESLVTASDD